ncbi:MAG: NAD-dependent epimerase/dehydratase family protein [Thermodesulfobacteriota bacterium]
MSENIIVLGGDGFCGWPTSLHLSRAGYQVTIVDNLSRRMIDVELECESLTPIQSLSRRLKTWKEVSGQVINFERINLAEHYHRLLSLIKELKPRAIIHFAEQRAAPYSMKSSWHKRYTVNNNLNATHNVLAAIVESGLDVHLVHLGTTGVYGYGTPGMPIPEGYLTIKVEVDGKEKQMEILYPANPGSVYHMTKTQDALFFYYYNKNDQVRITDLHQGIVWGTNTPETLMDPHLINRFDYDGDFGTVLNRFLVQSVLGHPLTVHGTGGQERAFINIQDTVKCLELAVANPPLRGERVKIFNQVTETHKVRDLAQLVARMTGAQIRYYNNPRLEDQENTLWMQNQKFLELGLEPVTLDQGLLKEILDIAQKYSQRCDLSKIPCTSTWRSDIECDTQGRPEPGQNSQLQGKDLPRARCTKQGE